MNVAEIILAGGVQQIGAVLPQAIGWALLAVGVLVALKLNLDARRHRRQARIVFDALQGCRWCTPRNGCTDPNACLCKVPCAQSYCKARAVTADA